MAKRVAAQRRGLLYGLIATIFVAVILAILLFLQVSEKTKILRATVGDPNADPAKIAKDLERVQADLRSKGVTTSSKLTLFAAIDDLLKGYEEYERGIRELAFVVNQQSPSADQHRDALLKFATDQKLAGDGALKLATEALKIAPQQPDVTGIKAETPASLVSAAQQMKIHLEKLVETYNQKLRTLQDYQSKYEASQTSLDRLQKAEQEKFDKMFQEKEKVIADQRDTVQKKEEEANEALREKEAIRETLLKAQNEAKAEAQKLKNTIAQLEVRLEEIMQGINRALARQFEPDGKIVRLAPGSRTGYINLAKGDGVFNNLTFFVFDSAELGKETPAPKGFIRIVNVMDDSSEVYVTSYRKSDPIVEGDLITNVAYNRDRRFHFAVVGRFDIDGTGGAKNDIAIIKDLIQRFGGKVDEEINVQTDYLVVGEDPLSTISVSAGGPTSPQQQAEIEKLKKEQEKMSDATNLARRYWIPVLNQNRFLALVGIRPADMN